MDDVIKLFFAADSDTERRSVLTRMALDAPGVFSFGELLEGDSSNVLQQFFERHRTLHNTFLLFSYGTYQDYLRITKSLTVFTEVEQLTAVQERKLKQLSVITLATQARTVSYNDLMAAIHANSVKEMEDFVVDELVYSGLISGKLDQQNRVLCVDWINVMRDVPRETMASLVVAPLRKWTSECRGLLDQMHTQEKAVSQALADAQKEKDMFVDSLCKVRALNEQNSSTK